jgi:hypothetical protein
MCLLDCSADVLSLLPAFESLRRLHMLYLAGGDGEGMKAAVSWQGCGRCTGQPAVELRACSCSWQS